MDINLRLSEEFKISKSNTDNIIELINDGNTIPFIARYRKEATGNCDDQILREFSERLVYLTNLEKRKVEVIKSITEQEKMTDEIMLALERAETMTEVEDIYRPYKPKKKTRASVAIEKGLQPLADIIIAQQNNKDEILNFANEYINLEKGVETQKDAYDGASDIVAEYISDNAELRKKLRATVNKNGSISSKYNPKTTAKNYKVYEIYFDFEEAVNTIPSHRILAINRGETEEVLNVKIEFNDELGVRICLSAIRINNCKCEDILLDICADSYSRLIFPSIEREVRNELTEKASEAAIATFEVNLKQLLLQPPIKGKVTLGFDPAYRTGCKIAVVNEFGKVLDTTVVYPTQPQNKVEEAKEILKNLINKYNVDIISIGNGTASKESEIFVAELIKEQSRKVSYMVVSEAGASVYSASKLGAEEFPDFDVSLRSAVSIARRLQDPLSELCKIEPKSIGVGQYQHDMPKNNLETALNGVLEDCVNSVGVDVNTASVSLLSCIAGLNAGVAKNIIAHREKNGAFSERSELKSVAKLGDKAFTQCAGFLRIPRGKNVFDNTAVHPESYDAAKKLLKLFNYDDSDIANNKISDLKIKAETYGFEKVASHCDVGIPTLLDIITEILKPGRDIRDDLPPPMLRSDILDMKDLKPGMELKGTVRNVIDFGVFVDIGVHQDGLVHISELCDRYIKHPLEVVKVGDIVTVRVLSVDLNKNRISLTLKTNKSSQTTV